MLKMLFGFDPRISQEDANVPEHRNLRYSNFRPAEAIINRRAKLSRPNM